MLNQPQRRSSDFVASPRPSRDIRGEALPGPGPFAAFRVPSNYLHIRSTSPAAPLMQLLPVQLGGQVHEVGGHVVEGRVRRGVRRAPRPALQGPRHERHIQAHLAGR